MRLLASAFAVLLVSVLGCAGDSSSLMSVWNDGGPGGAFGGQGGQTVPSSGGAGGTAGASGGGSIAVRGGTRDLATAQCTSATAPACPVDGVYLNCVQSHCGPLVTDCYYSDGVSSAAGGRCRAYANCMLGCPCDRDKYDCENQCLQDYGFTDTSCSQCLVTLFTCLTSNGCTPPATCASSSGGS
jgi:hypothetical protein